MFKALFHRALVPAPRLFVISRYAPPARSGKGGPQTARHPHFRTPRPLAGVYERAPAPCSGNPGAGKLKKAQPWGRGDWS